MSFPPIALLLLLTSMLAGCSGGQKGDTESEPVVISGSSGGGNWQTLRNAQSRIGTLAQLLRDGYVPTSQLCRPAICSSLTGDPLCQSLLSLTPAQGQACGRTTLQLLDTWERLAAISPEKLFRKQPSPLKWTSPAGISNLYSAVAWPDRNLIVLHEKVLEPTYDRAQLIALLLHEFAHFRGVVNGVDFRRDDLHVEGFDFEGGLRADLDSTGAFGGVLTRQVASGALDTLLAGTGYATSSLDYGYQFNRTIPLRNGRLVSVGDAWLGTAMSRDFLLERRLPDGSPDLTFGTPIAGLRNGRVRIPQAGLAQRLVELPDRSLLVLGSTNLYERLQVRKFTPDGQADITFGEGGVLYLDIPSVGINVPRVYGTDIAVVGDRAWVLGEVQSEELRGLFPAVARLFSFPVTTPAGESESSVLEFPVDFRTGAGANALPSEVSRARRLLVAADGSALVIGSRCRRAALQWWCNAAVLRFKSWGNVDTEYGNDHGVFVFPVDPSVSMHRGIDATLLPDGGALVLAETANTLDLVAGSTFRAQILRLTAQGQWETSLCGDGICEPVLERGAPYRPTAIQLDPDAARFFLTGTLRSPAVVEPLRGFVAAFDTGGQPDLSFGDSGYVKLRMTGDAQVVGGIAVAPHGRIVLSGSSKSGPLVSATLWRLFR